MGWTHYGHDAAESPGGAVILRGVLPAVAFGSMLVAQGPDSAEKSGSPNAAPFRISGFVTTSYTYASQPDNGTIVGRMYGRRQARVVLNVADVVMERRAALDRWDFGFRFEPILGLNAAVVRAGGLDLGRHADLWQGYGVLSVPAGKDRSLSIKAGKMATLMGVEVFADIENPTLEVGTQDIFLEPFSETGVELEASLGPALIAQLRVSQGWDRVSDNNSGKTATVRLGITPDANTLVALLAYSGPEQAGSTLHSRSGAQVLLADLITPRLRGWLQLDYGREGGAGAGTGDAEWYAAGVWLAYQLSHWTGLGVRADYVCDCNGGRTGGGLGYPVHSGQNLTSLTGTLNVRHGAHLLLRPEIRFDGSTLPVFHGHRQQVSGGLGLSYIF